jgi:hypothetical protein
MPVRHRFPGRGRFPRAQATTESPLASTPQSTQDVSIPQPMLENNPNLDPALLASTARPLRNNGGVGQTETPETQSSNYLSILLFTNLDTQTELQPSTLTVQTALSNNSNSTNMAMDVESDPFQPTLQMIFGWEDERDEYLEFRVYFLIKITKIRLL